MSKRLRKHIKVGMWEFAPFLEIIAERIKDLNLFLNERDYELDYSIIKLSSDVSKAVDILFLDGGQDINPSRYYETNIYSNGCSDSRDKAEYDLLLRINWTKLSGICRGLQLINVYFGGTLYQDIDKQLNIQHHNPHEVEVPSNFGSLKIKPSHLCKFIPQSTFLVSSLHHQCIKKLCESFRKTLQVTYQSFDEDTREFYTVPIIEGIESSSGDIRAVQSHPEFVYFPQTDGLLFSYLMHVDYYIEANQKVKSPIKSCPEFPEEILSSYVSSTETTSLSSDIPYSVEPRLGWYDVR